jgi:aminocarboxymuconate-semialdehyde decarboxylase
MDAKNAKAALRAAATIDVHAHAVLAPTMNMAGRHGPEIGYREDGTPWFRIGDYRFEGVRYEGSPFMDPVLRVEGMDTAGIDYQVLSPNPLTYFHFIEAEAARRFCIAHNDALAEVVAGHPQRLGAFAALPMQDVAAACDELERAVTELGFLGAYIGTDLGRPLNAPDFDPFYEKVVALDVPLFIHPGPAGLDGPAGDPNLGQFDLEILCGFAAQETIAVATLIYGGVLHRHPDLDICLSHAGGATVALIGRLNRACTRRAWVPGHLRHEGAFEEQLARLWFDTHVHDPRVLDLVMAVMGRERLVMGTNFAGWDQHAISAGNLHAALFANNARRLLRADG